MSNENSLNNEWESFMTPNYKDDFEDVEVESDDNDNDTMDYLTVIPKATDIYISTKTKIAYLNKAIDLKEVFWKIPVIPYASPKQGVIKKQMKFNSLVPEELDDVKENLKDETCYDEYVITSINNPSGRIKFKDIRKVSIGISKKDLMSYRCKKKSAFYNCFVIILRIKIEEKFKEFHIKVFNTGKLEIPGIQKEETFQLILQTVIQTLEPFQKDPLFYREDTTETVLINSNFNCGFYINRDSLFDILKYKYNIQSIYDPCSYPGIQCKFYYNPDVEEHLQTGSHTTDSSEDADAKKKSCVQVSFMIFRTGSVLIVGKCDENVLFIIYDFLKKILLEEHRQIHQEQNVNIATAPAKVKKNKIRRKIINVTI